MITTILILISSMKYREHRKEWFTPFEIRQITSFKQIDFGFKYPSQQKKRKPLGDWERNLRVLNQKTRKL